MLKNENIVFKLFYSLINLVYKFYSFAFLHSRTAEKKKTGDEYMYKRGKVYSLFD